MRTVTKLATAIVAGVLIASPLQAQFFGNDVPTEPVRNEPQSNIAPDKTAPESTKTVTPFDYGKQEFKDQVEKNISDGKMVHFVGDDPKRDEEVILMFMKNFNIYRSPSGKTRCSATFSIVTTLPTYLSNISYQLQWPDMSTVLSFNNVEPQVENYYNYSLLGDGCYSMDKAPNIVINRCRVKGMSQQVCASKVRWITRAQ